VPVGDVLLYSNTAYSGWNLLWLLLLLVYAPLPPSSVMIVLQWLLMLLLLASTPLSVLIVPICVYNLWTRRTGRDWFVNGTLLAAIGIYLVTAVVTTDEQFVQPWRSLSESFWLIIHRVVAESLVGYTLRIGWQQAGYPWLVARIGLTVLGFLLAWYLARGRQLAWVRHVQIGLVVYLIAASTLIIVLARAASASLWGSWELRYFYLQQKLFWLLLLTVGAFALLRLPRPALRYVGGSLFVVYLIWLATMNWALFSSSPTSGQQLAAFLHEVSQAIHTPASAPQEFVLPRGCFDIKIRT